MRPDRRRRVDPLPEGGRLADSQVQSRSRSTRYSTRSTRDRERVPHPAAEPRSAPKAAPDLSDAFGNLGPFSRTPPRSSRSLNRQGDALSQVINSTGPVFESLTARDQQLAGLIQGNNRTFGALASRDERSPTRSRSSRPSTRSRASCSPASRASR